MVSSLWWRLFNLAASPASRDDSSNIYICEINVFWLPQGSENMLSLLFLCLAFPTRLTYCPSVVFSMLKKRQGFLYFCHWIISYRYVSHMVNLCLVTRNNAEVNNGLILSGCSLRVKAFCIQKDHECFRATLWALWPQRCLYLYLRLTIVIGLRRTGITDITNLKI